ncbi:hypothetical protein [Streptacidiphilus albus]|nr:hypothetical protein [Streptacidiphilus albus]
MRSWTPGVSKEERNAPGASWGNGDGVLLAGTAVLLGSRCGK